MNSTTPAEMKIYPFHTQQTETCDRNKTQHLSTVMITQVFRDRKAKCTGLILLFPFPIPPCLCAPSLPAGSWHLWSPLAAEECLWGFSLPSTQSIHPSSKAPMQGYRATINSPSEVPHAPSKMSFFINSSGKRWYYSHKNSANTSVTWCKD